MAELDVLSLAEARKAVNLDQFDETEDAELQAIVTAVSRLFDAEFGAMVVRDVVETIDGPVASLWLRQWPVSSVTSITEDGTAVEATDFQVVDAGFGRIRRLSGGYFSAWGGAPGTVVVTYTAGRYADTASVDERVKYGAKLTLKNLWRSTLFTVIDSGEYDTPSQAFPRFVIPNAVKELLADLRRPPVVV